MFMGTQKPEFLLSLFPEDFYSQCFCLTGLWLAKSNWLIEQVTQLLSETKQPYHLFLKSHCSDALLFLLPDVPTLWEISQQVSLKKYSGRRLFKIASCPK